MSRVALACLVSCAAFAEERQGVVRVSTPSGEINAHFYRPARFDADQHGVLFVQHGMRRNAAEYLQKVIPLADRQSVLLIAVEFDRQQFPRGSDFTLGVHSRGRHLKRRATQGENSETPIEWRLRDRMSYAVLEQVFDRFTAIHDIRQTQYCLIGHSAGGQFVHRLVSLLPANRVRAAVAANAGWYTLMDERDAVATRFPYGLARTAVDQAQMRQALATPMLILLGQADTLRTENLRQTEQADSQGRHRLARGRYYFATAAATSRRLETLFAWELAEVPDVGHDLGGLLAQAEHYLFGNSGRCRASN